MKTYKGRFKPKNPTKYRGDHTNIVYRSSWELKVMFRFDNDPNVIWWSSEETVIPYRSPVDNRVHRYFVDFTVRVKRPDGTTRTILIEVKPHKQTQPPPAPKNAKSKRYLNEVMTWGVNSAKWKAAGEYCKDRGFDFMIITENELGLNNKSW